MAMDKPNMPPNSTNEFNKHKIGGVKQQTWEAQPPLHNSW